MVLLLLKSQFWGFTLSSGGTVFHCHPKFSFRFLSLFFLLYQFTHLFKKKLRCVYVSFASSYSLVRKHYSMCVF